MLEQTEKKKEEEYKQHRVCFKKPGKEKKKEKEKEKEKDSDTGYHAMANNTDSDDTKHSVYLTVHRKFWVKPQAEAAKCKVT